MTFLHHFLYPKESETTVWQKIQQIEAYAPQVEREIDGHEQLLRRVGWITDEVAQKGLLDRLGVLVEPVLLGYRRRGQQIMNVQVQRLRPFSMSVILDEVQRYLSAGTRHIDFDAVLGLWPSPEDASRTHSITTRFLERHSSARTLPMTRNASRLLEGGEFALSALLYQLALRSAEALGDSAAQMRQTIMLGLSRCFLAQENLKGAAEMAIRARAAWNERNHELEALFVELSGRGVAFEGAE